VKNFECAKIYTNDYKKANKMLTKTVTYLHRNSANTTPPPKKKNCGMNNKETLSKELRADRVTLFVQFWFKFANKKHFKNQAIKFILTIL